MRAAGAGSAVRPGTGGVRAGRHSSRTGSGGVLGRRGTCRRWSASASPPCASGAWRTRDRSVAGPGAVDGLARAEWNMRPHDLDIYDVDLARERHRERASKLVGDGALCAVVQPVRLPSTARKRPPLSRNCLSEDAIVSAPATVKKLVFSAIMLASASWEDSQTRRSPSAPSNTPSIYRMT